MKEMLCTYVVEKMDKYTKDIMETKKINGITLM